MSYQSIVPTEKGVVAAVVHEGEILILRRCAKHSIGRWEGVAGKVDGDESNAATLHRELLEEAGIQPSDIGAITRIGHIDVPILADPTYTGEPKRWLTFFFLVTLTTRENVSLKEPHIHDHLEWLPVDSFVSVGLSGPIDLTMMSQYLAFS